MILRSSSAIDAVESLIVTIVRRLIADGTWRYATLHEDVDDKEQARSVLGVRSVRILMVQLWAYELAPSWTRWQ
jgi:hypothetical protein